MNNRSFQSPGMVLNSVRVIGPDFTTRRSSFDHFNSFTFRRNSSINTTTNSTDNIIIADETLNNVIQAIPTPTAAATTTTAIRARSSVMNSESNSQSRPSPDEIVIKGRGRRSLPVKWSPIPIESPQKTPLSSLIKNSPKRGLIALRSSPRKRLQLNDGSSELVQSRKNLLNSSPLARRTSTTDLNASSPTPDKLSKDQLVHVLNSIVRKHPHIREEIGSILSTKGSSSDSGLEDSGVCSKNTTFETIKSDTED